MTLHEQIEARAREILRASGPFKGYLQAYAEAYDELTDRRHTPADDEALLEAEHALFDRRPRPKLTGEDVADAADRLFGGGGPGDLSESFRRRGEGR